VRVTAFTSMALQAASSPRPMDGREAVQLIDAARSAIGDGTPRLHSLLSAREALGHARNGDRRAAVHALAVSERLLDHESTDGEPAWLWFWGDADLACHQSRVSLFLGDLAPAEAAARTALSYADEATYPRNHTIYSGRLGNVLARAGRLEESIAIMTPVVNRVQTFGSSRIRSDVCDTIELLDHHQGYRPARQFTAWSRKVLAVA
jgi:hypothetical protein